MKKIVLLKGLIVALVVCAVLGSLGIITKLVIETYHPTVTKVASATPTPASSFVQYSGEDGIDALTLLKEQALVHESSPGFVDAINGKKAEASKHEYWAFYVNGKLANVGAAAYKTHDGDTIEWKIEKF